MRGYRLSQLEGNTAQFTKQEHRMEQNPNRLGPEDFEGGELPEGLQNQPEDYSIYPDHQAFHECSWKIVKGDMEEFKRRNCPVDVALRILALHAFEFALNQIQKEADQGMDPLLTMSNAAEYFSNFFASFIRLGKEFPESIEGIRLEGCAKQFAQEDPMRDIRKMMEDLGVDFDNQN